MAFGVEEKATIDQNR